MLSRGSAAARMSSEDQNSVFLLAAPFFICYFFSFLPLRVASALGGRAITRLALGRELEHPSGTRAHAWKGARGENFFPALILRARYLPEALNAENQAEAVGASPIGSKESYARH